MAFWIGLSVEELMRLSDAQLAEVPIGEWRERLCAASAPPDQALVEQCDDLESQIEDLEWMVDDLRDECKQAETVALSADLTIKKMTKALAELHDASQLAVDELGVGKAQEASHRLGSALEQLNLNAWLCEQLEQYRTQQTAYEHCA